MNTSSSLWKAVLMTIGMSTLTLAFQVTSTVLQVGYQPTLDALRNAKFCKRNVPEQYQQQSMTAESAADELMVEIIGESK
jgi:hypothetical protein